MKKTTFDLGKKWDIDQQADNNLSIWVDQERMNGTLLATVYNEVDDKDETHVAIAELIASAPLMKAYIDYVEGKLDMGEIPLDFEQWQDFEQNIAATEDDAQYAYWQPAFDGHEEQIGLGEDEEPCFSFQVWRKKENLMKAYPTCTPVGYFEDDIEEPQYMD